MPGPWPLAGSPGPRGPGNPGVGRQDLYALAALVALTALAFHPILLSPAGPRYTPGGDIAWYFYPVQRYVVGELARGALPLWTPHVAFGFPLLADIEAAALYLPGLLFPLLLGPGARALELQLAAHVAVSGAGMYVLLRGLGVSRPAALLGGAAWLLSGFLWAHSAHLSLIQSAAWVPWLLWAFDRALRGGTRHGTMLAGGFLALTVLGGHPQIAWYALLALLAWALLHTRPADRQGPGIAAAAATLGGTLLAGLGLSAVQILPTLELARRSTRWGVSESFLFEEALPPAHLLTLLLPLAYQGTGRWRSVDEFHAYMGVAPLALAAAALLGGRGPRVRAGAAFLLLGLTLALGLHRPLVRWVPGLAFFRVPARALFLTDLAVALLAGMGADGLRRSGPGPRILAGTLAAVALTSLAAGAVLGGRVPPLPALAPALPAQLGWFGLGCLVTALAALLVARAPQRAWPVAGLVGLLVADQLVTVPRTLMWSRTPAEAWWPETAVLRSIREDPGLFRVWTDGTLYGRSALREANVGLVHGVQTSNLLFGSSLSLARAARFVRSFGERLREHPHLLDLANVRYLVTPDPPGPPERYERLGPVLWRNRWVLPRAFLVGEAQVLPNAATVLERLRTLDPRRAVLLERPRSACAPLTRPQPAAGPPVGVAQVLAYTPTRILLEVDARAPAALVVTDTHYPGWRAAVDGQRVPLLRANFLFRAVCLPAGRHRVELRYEPRAFRIGLAITLGTAAVLAVAGWRGRRARSRAGWGPCGS